MLHIVRLIQHHHPRHSNRIIAGLLLVLAMAIALGLVLLALR